MAADSSTVAGLMLSIPPQLQEVYDVSVMEAVHNKKLVKLIDIFQSDQSLTNTSNINVLGLVVSATMPRACSVKASHKFSCSFFIIDPFHHDPSKSICVNLFFNDLSKYNPIARVGDIIFCESLKLQRYQNFPQLVGSFEKGCICIFHLKHDYKLGLCDRTSWEAVQVKNRSVFILNPEQWSLHVYTTGQNELDKVPSLLTRSILLLTGWAESFFKQRSLADDKFFHVSLHSLFTYCHTLKGDLEDYNGIVPQALMPLQSIYIESPGQDTLKVDFVGMVLHRIESSEPGAPLQLVLWDGTAHGMTNLSTYGAECAARVHASLSSVLQYLPPTPNRAALIERWPTMHETLPPSHFIGKSLIVEAADPAFNVYLQRYTAGLWIRIRNLHVLHSVRPNCPVALIKQDTHIGSLDPHYRDVTLLFQHYADRLEAFAPPPSPRPQQARNHTGGQGVQQGVQQSATSSSSGNARSMNAAGHPYTSLCEVACFPPPKNYCCRGRLVDWFPKPTKDFVQIVSTGDHSSKESTFCFVLRIQDNTFTLDVLLHGDEAEKFLGVSAQQFARNADLQQSLETQLERTKVANVIFDFHVKVYTIKQGSKRTLGTRWKTSVAHSGLKWRFSMFDSQAPFDLLKAA